MESENFSGEGIKKAMYQKENWVPKGLEESVFHTWKEDDHED